MLNFSLYVVFWLTLYSLILLGFVSLVFSVLRTYFRYKHYDLTKFDRTFFLVKLPPDSEVEIKVAEQLFASLHGFKRSWWDSLWKSPIQFSFEIIGKNSGIGFYVVCPKALAPAIEKKINGAYPGAEIDIVEPQRVWDRGKFTSALELRFTGYAYFPIKTYEDLPSDGLSAITSAMSKLSADETVAVQYVIQSASNTWRRQGSSFISRVKRRSADPEKGGAVDTSFLEGVEKKISRPGFNVAIRLISTSDSRFTADDHVRNLLTSFEQFTDVKYNSFKGSRKNSWRLIHDFIYRYMHVVDLNIPILDIPLYRNVPVLNTAELATVLHFPGKEVKTPGIIWLKSRKAPAPENVPSEGLYLGINEFRGFERKVYMLRKDRNRHFYILGQTGTGKSEFMKTLALQDIENGEGLAFIDPHGSDIDDLLEKIPEHRMDDVILFDAADTDYPIGLNILEAHSEEEKHMIINAFIGLLYKLYDPQHQGIMGPQLERAIRNVMLTAMSDPESTLVDVVRILIDDDYARSYLPKIKDPLVRRYWTDEQAKTTANRKGEMMGYFVSKFDRFVTDRTMRLMLGQPSSALNFHKIMAEKKILLVDLSKGKIGEENSNFIGLLLVPRILQAAMARASILGREEFPDFYLYVDEFQNFATDDFATILSEARKYKLNLIVAHQFVSQLDEKIKNAVFGNVGTMAIFRIGPDDAPMLEKQFEPTFTQSDLTNLPIGNFYTRLLVKGHPTVPFSMRVDWESVNIANAKKSPERAQAIRDMSRKRYGTPAQEVESFIAKRAGMDAPSTSASSSLPNPPDVFGTLP